MGVLNMLFKIKKAYKEYKFYVDNLELVKQVLNYENSTNQCSGNGATKEWIGVFIFLRDINKWINGDIATSGEKRWVINPSLTQDGIKAKKDIDSIIQQKIKNSSKFILGIYYITTCWNKFIKWIKPLPKSIFFIRIIKGVWKLIKWFFKNIWIIALFIIERLLEHKYFPSK
jgi:hypothetical protein